VEWSKRGDAGIEPAHPAFGLKRWRSWRPCRLSTENGCFEPLTFHPSSTPPMLLINRYSSLRGRGVSASRNSRCCSGSAVPSAAYSTRGPWYFFPGRSESGNQGKSGMGNFTAFSLLWYQREVRDTGSRHHHRVPYSFATAASGNRTSPLCTLEIWGDQHQTRKYRHCHRAAYDGRSCLAGLPSACMFRTSSSFSVLAIRRGHEEALQASTP
jgi:hypothetical protein